jgi:hypothetical protein
VKDVVGCMLMAHVGLAHLSGDPRRRKRSHVGLRETSLSKVC